VRSFQETPPLNLQRVHPGRRSVCCLRAARLRAGGPLRCRHLAVLVPSVQHHSTGQRQARGRGSARGTEILGEPHLPTVRVLVRRVPASKLSAEPVHAQARASPAVRRRLREDMCVKKSQDGSLTCSVWKTNAGSGAALLKSTFTVGVVDGGITGALHSSSPCGNWIRDLNPPNSTLGDSSLNALHFCKSHVNTITLHLQREHTQNTHKCGKKMP